MAIPYRTKRLLGRLGILLLSIAIALAVVAGCYLLLANKHITYDRYAGAIYDPHHSTEGLQWEQVQETEPAETVTIYYNEGENQLNVSTDLTQMVGYYVTAQELQTNIGAVKTQLQQLEKGTAVMFDVKSIKGNFFYSSNVATYRNPDIDIAAMDELLEYLKLSDLYAVARLPAFRDFNYGLNHVPDGLPAPGGYLWMDDDRCYWLNPTSQGTINYLVNIINELKKLGFDEVVFYDFCFPETDGIVFKQDKTQALTDTAQLLVDTCATETFAVSFVGKTDFPLPDGRSRLYMEGVEAAQAAALAAQTGMEDPSVYLVFLTDLHDTRFDAYSVLRPLSAAH